MESEKATPPRKDALKALKKRLPKRFADPILQRLDHQYSKPTVYAVLDGKFENTDIIDAALAVAEEYEQQRDKLLKKKAS